MHKYGYYWLECSTLNTREIQDFIKANRDAWNLINNSDWTEETLVFSEELVRSFLGDAGTSRRIEMLSKSRYSSNIRVRVGKVSRVKLEIGSCIAVRQYQAYARIARSRTESRRTVFWREFVRSRWEFSPCPVRSAWYRKTHFDLMGQHLKQRIGSTNPAGKYCTVLSHVTSRNKPPGDGKLP